MSSILKALKKLEQEKTMRREGEIDLTREILHDAWRRKTRFPWPWAGAITMIVLLLVLVAVLLTRETPPVRTPAPVQTQVQTQASPQKAPSPVAVKTEQSADPIAKPSPVLRKPAQAVLPKPAAVAPVQPPATIPVPLPTPQPQAVQAESPYLPPTAAPPPAVSSQPSAKKPAAPAEQAEPAFAVSGIAWNKDSADRLAIVNGMPLTTGSAIGGAVIEEILPDRVRFSRGGGSFEVHLGKGAKNNQGQIK